MEKGAGPLLRWFWVMKSSIESLLTAIRARHVATIVGLSFCLLYFLISLGVRSSALRKILLDPVTSALLAVSVIAIFFISWLWTARQFATDTSTALIQSSITFFPWTLLLCWPAADSTLPLLIPLGTVFTLQIMFFMILSRGGKELEIETSRLFFWIFFLGVGYLGLILSHLARLYDHAALFNPKDFSAFNQIFWNTLHGDLFLSSQYGMLFACHNNLFFLWLVPLYYLAPHLLTLSVIKSLLLVLALVPFYLLARRHLNNLSILAMSLVFLLYPGLIAQHFSPPHEISFVPFFAFFAYYFYRIQRFALFVAFLLICLSMKEHVALLALAFGFVSLIRKRSWPWIWIPVILGIFWAGLSWAVLAYFKSAYREQYLEQTWLIDNFIARFSAEGANPYQALWRGFASSNLTRWPLFQSAFVFLTPLGLILPLLSTTSLLGLPELVINLVSDRPALLSPLRHYNILVSCFLLLATLEGIDNMSQARWPRRLKIRPRIMKSLLALFALGSTLMNSHIWIPLTSYEAKLSPYQASLKAAIKLIPEGASVTAATHLAPYISGRRDFSFWGSPKYGEYILLDGPSLASNEGLEIPRNYHPIFSDGNILLYKRL